LIIRLVKIIKSGIKTMRNLKKTIAAAIAVLMAITSTVYALASWEDDLDYSVTGDFPENVSVEIYGGADSEGLQDEYAVKYGNIVGCVKKLVVRIEEKVTLNSDPMNEDVTYKELSSLDCKTTFTIAYTEPGYGVYFLNDATEDIEKMNTKYDNGKYTFKVDTVYPGMLFLSKYELSDDETVAKQTLEDSETGIKAEGSFINGTFMETSLYDDEWTEYSVVFGRNFKLLDKVDAKLYIPCENSKAKAGFMDYDEEMKFIDFGAEYTDGYLVINTKNIPPFELKDIFVGTDEEISEYINTANTEGSDNNEPTQQPGTEPNKAGTAKTETSTANSQNTVSQGKSAVSTGDSSNAVIIVMLTLTAFCTALIIKKSKE